MKRNLFNRKRVAYSAGLLCGVVMLLFATNVLRAQVTFTQTLNADFYKGAYSNVVVGSDNVYLQLSATDPGSWLTTTVLPQTICGHRAVSWNDRYAYVVGGFNNLTYLSTVYKAEITSGGVYSWVAQNPLPVALRDPAVVIGTNTIYVMGGRDGSQVYNTIYYASIASDGTLGAWQTSAVTLPAARWGHTATYCMGYIYVMGGSASLTESTALNTVYYTKVNALNTLSAFTAGTALPAARNRHATVTYNSKLIVIGGYDNSGTKSNAVYYATPALNGSTGSWTTAAGTLPVVLSNHSAVVANGLLMVMAGANSTTLSNVVYYCNPDVLTWSTSSNVMYDNTKDGSAFAGNGQVYYTGGTNLSGTPIINCRFANMTMSANYITHGVFVSNPFYELGAERTITSITFNKSVIAPATLQVSYRVAGADGVWGDWAAYSATSPIAIGLTKQYLQYAVNMAGSTTNNAILNDMNLITPGTQLNGNLNGIATFTKALSPYWATSDISFTAGTHTFEAGATILFLPQTGLSVGQAHMECLGTAVDTVKFMYYTTGNGQWDGIYFGDESDNGVNSNFAYTLISGAGYGSNAANLNCASTSEPTLNHCLISNSSVHGIVLSNSSLVIQNSVIKSNTADGLYLSASNPIVNNTTISYNSGGIEMSNASSLPNFSSSVSSYNTYGVYYSTINMTLSPVLGTLTLTGNTYNGICFPGGQVSDNQRWKTLPAAFPIFIMGDLNIGKYGDKSRLTIEPGNTIKMAPGKKIQIGGYWSYHSAGELYAIGTADSAITFTPINGLSGGWEGIYFEDRSDYWGAASVMDYCVVEKGNTFNVYFENTNSPTLNHSTIRNAAQDGIRFYGAYNSVSNTTLQANGRYPIYYAEPLTSPVLYNNTFPANTINMLGFCGGQISEDRTFSKIGIPYHIIENTWVGKYNSNCTLTIKPGVTLNFASGKNLQIGAWSGYYCGGNLQATGKVDTAIIFKPYSNTAGDWNGIFFSDISDWGGGTNNLKYCTITQGNAYNVYLESTSNVTIDHCTLNGAISDGARYSGSYGTLTSNAFTNNGRYPLYFTEWSSQPFHRYNTFTGNDTNMIALSGGNYTSSRILYKDGAEYLYLDNVLIGPYNSVCRLTVEPGVTVNFAPGKGIQVGLFTSYYCGGELWAEGKADSLIVFKPQTGVAGGWTGIYFTDFSDWNGSNSRLKYCTVTKGGNYNVWCEATGSILIDHCTISYAVTDGLRYSSGSTGTLTYNTINNNGRYPLYFMDWGANPTHNNNTFTANVPNQIIMSGGTYSSSRTIQKDGAEYLVLDNILIGVYNAICRVTVEPGVTLKFASGKGIQVGFYSSYHQGGELWAEGDNSNWINFGPNTEIQGDWTGILFADQSDWNGATSSLKYCLVKKGAPYNVRCDYSNMPTIDHCKITQALGTGLYFYESSPALKSSNVTFNTQYGIYVYTSGAGTFGFGNSEANTNNFYNNSLYELYNNSPSTLLCTYNFWGTGDSTMIHTKIYDKNDNSAKGRVYIGPFAQLPNVLTTNMTVSGTLKYASPTANPIKNAAMAITTFAGANVATTTSNTSGVYAFPTVVAGTYKMPVTPPSPTAPTNSTDALLILNHFAQISLLSDMKLAAADVNYSHSINGTDAMLVMKRYSGLISTFPAGDYLYHADTIIVNGSTGATTYNLDMICYGDVNASYAPAKKSTQSLGLIYEGSLLTNSFEEFEFPVRMKTGMQVGAISLGFYYPDQYLEITNARLANGESGFSWTATDGLFRMGWASTNSLNINDDEVIVILTMKAKDLTYLAKGINLELYEYCEFADGSATPNELAVISVPTINTTLTGTGHSGSSPFALNVYPNPVTGTSVISFNLEKPAEVNICLVDMIGNKVLDMGTTSCNAGSHKVGLGASAVKPGVYFLKFTAAGNGQTVPETIKVVVSR